MLTNKRVSRADLIRLIPDLQQMKKDSALRLLRHLRETVNGRYDEFKIIIGSSQDGYFVCDTKETLSEYIASMKAQARNMLDQVKEVETIYTLHYGDTLFPVDEDAK